MFWFIAGLVISIFIAYRVSDEGYGKEWGVFFGMFAFFGVLSFFMACGINYAVSAAMSPREVLSETELVAIQDGSATSGSFFLGSGTIDDEQVFSYYAKSGDYYTLENTPAEMARIKFGDNPRVQTIGFEPSSIWFGATGDVTSKVFIVPEGSIKQNFVLDAKN